MQGDEKSTHQLSAYGNARKQLSCAPFPRAQWSRALVSMQDVTGSRPDFAILRENRKMGKGTILEDHEDFTFHS